ncbi:uncharacterized protein LOC106150891 isoform X2 [Lingula anatina]|nr:uncharacterized protein LOC106150891 isoform X2 [Lingula anatina]|eukprot:XP_013379364.1 uncharacterized protein LOC106150891 isoform X2 [Lingula anatina]
MAAKHLNIRLSFMTGLAISFLGLVLSSIAPDITFLTISRGVFVGFGVNFTMVPISFLIAEWFPWEHRFHVLATSFRMMINPIGSVAGANLIRWINDLLGWRYSFGVLAILAVCTAFGLVLFLRHPEEQDKDKAHSEALEQSKIPWSRASKMIIFVLWVTISSCKAVGQTVFYTIVVKYGEDLGFDALTATHPLTADGITGSISRGLTSFLGDYIKGNILHMYAVCATMLSVANVLVPYVKSPVELIIFGAVIGAGQGPILAAWYAACSEALGGESVHTLFVLQLVSWGIGQSIGSILPGLILDFTKSYTLLFHVLAVSYGFIVFGFICIILLNRRHASVNEGYRTYNMALGKIGSASKTAEDMSTSVYRLILESYPKYDYVEERVQPSQDER